MTVAQLEAYLAVLEGRRQSGQLRIFTTGRAWVLFLSAGRLLWADGGTHPRRRLRRRIRELQRLTDGQLSGIANRELDTQALGGSTYGYFLEIYEQRQISSQQFCGTVAAVAAELLFEIWAVGSKRAQFPTKFVTVWTDDLPLPKSQASSVEGTAISLSAAVAAAKQAWSVWQSKIGTTAEGGELPNLAPRILKPDLLRESVNQATYDTMIARLNGSNTLSDLATLLGLKIVQLATLLQPLALQGILTFESVADFGEQPRPTREATVKPPEKKPLLKTPAGPSRPATATPATKRAAPLIACIDDSRQSCQLVGWFLEKAGYQFCYTTEPAEAIPLLMQRRPGLIFLDLVMPGVSGYELCTAIRRVSVLESVPIAIVTGRDGIVDRMRAKMIGATNFVSKPLQREAILQVAQQHLPLTSPPPATGS